MGAACKNLTPMQNLMPHFLVSSSYVNRRARIKFEDGRVRLILSLVPRPF